VTGGADARSGSRQAAVTRSYDRIAPVYDLLERPMDLMVGKWRRRMLATASGVTLEVGVGTGRNLEAYPPGVELTGIDVSAKMVERARVQARRRHVEVDLQVADVQHLPFEDDSFDTVVATCVFCSVADPVAGLSELARVVRPDGRVLLLEHVRPRNPLLGWLADRLSPLVRRLFGPEINRRTEDNIARAGLEIGEQRARGVWREFVAHAPT
jgi:ubiquinone/menaquinone biosynthesis C-methylase UbiE